MLVDTHAHVQDAAFDADRSLVIERANAAGVAVICVGVDLASSRAAVALAAQHAGLYAAVGVHPHEARGLTAQALAELRRLCLHPKVVAVGETGLDWHRNLSSRSEQCDAFLAHLYLAREVDLPVIVHNRQADEDVLRLWSGVRGVRGVLHAYSSDVAMAQRAVAQGLYVSLAGPLTYKNADMTRQTAKSLPLERVLLETDCPYLPPVPWRGQRNEPAHVALVAEAFARLRGLSLAEAAAATTANACELFGLPESMAT